MARVFIFMMDSFGIGGAPDAAAFGDEGAATFEHIAAAYPNLNIPNLLSLGLAKAAHEASGLNINLSPVSAQALNLPATIVPVEASRTLPPPISLSLNEADVTIVPLFCRVAPCSR